LGSTNRCADDEMLYSLKLLAKNTSFDEKPYIKENKKSLDWKSIKEIFARAGKTISEQKAESMGILSSYRGSACPTNGGIILFGKNRDSLFPSAMVRCALFGSIKREDIIDSLDIQESLISAIDTAMNFIARNSRTALKIEYLHHKKVPQYPPVALREALINAVVHADYAQEGSSITVALFQNRIEITNPGSLPCGLTLERALSGSSKLRNRVLGRVFRELGLIEQWSSGLQRIISSCEEHGLPQPLFEEIGNQFRVTIYSEILEKTASQEWKKEVVSHLKNIKK
jgi:predicted HTH transcriptional regulator